MNVFWGVLTIAIGAFLSLSGFLKSDFVVYQLLAARSRVLWGDKVHVFYAVVGIIVIVVGVLLALGMFRK